ncbi:MAG: glycosyltransferase [Candidatus Hydrogenedentota bacterium]
MPGTIIIPVYNKHNLVRKCVLSIINSFPSCVMINIIDNASDDLTITLLQQLQSEFNNINVIYNKENIGFARAVNQGLRMIEGDWCGIVNSDTEFDKESVSRLLNYVQNDKGSLFGPVTNYTGSRQIINVYANRKKFIAEFFTRQKSIAYEVERITGFAIFGANEIFEDVSEFDTSFIGGNFEDDDYILRALLKGYKVKIANDVYVEHLGHSSYGGMSDRFIKIIEKNKRIFLNKWLKNSTQKYVAQYIYLHSDKKEDKAQILQNFSSDYYIMLNRAIELYESKNYIETNETLKKILNSRDDDPFLYLFYGLSLYKLNRLDEALEFLKKSIEIRFFDRDALSKIARIYNEKSDILKAKDYINILYCFVKH